MPFSAPDRDRRGKAAAAASTKVKVRQATRRMPRLARWLTRRNALRRPVDRIEGAVLVALMAAFGVALAIASVFGTHVYQAEQAATASLRPVTAWLTAAGPAGGGLGHVGQVEARWSGPDGGEHTGVLTIATSPGISGAPAGTRIRVWLTSSGQPVPPPADRAVMIIYALTAGAAAAGFAGMGLLLVYLLCRKVLDRRRLAGWDSAWARTGPSWTARRRP